MPTTRKGRAASAASTEGAQTVRRAIAVLRALAGAQEQGARLSEIAEQCGLTRPTTHRLLRVLAEEGLAARRREDARYLIGSDAAVLGIARPSALAVRSQADPVLERIAQATGDSVALIVRSGADSLCVERRAGIYPIQVMTVALGARLPLGVGVGGLAIMAFMPDAEISELLKTNAARLARRKLTAEVLLARLGEVRRDMYAFTASGVVPGTHVLGVPVLAPTGEPLAAITISSIASRLPAVRAMALVPMMAREAQRLGRVLAARG